MSNETVAAVDPRKPRVLGDSEFYARAWVVHLNEYDRPGALVYAKSIEDALDAAADWHDEQGHEGMFLTPEEEREAEEEGAGVVFLGNYGRPMWSEHLHAYEVTAEQIAQEGLAVNAPPPEAFGE